MTTTTPRLLAAGFTERLDALQACVWPHTAPALYELFEQLGDGETLAQRDVKIVALVEAADPQVSQIVADLCLAFYATYDSARAEETLETFKKLLRSSKIPARDVFVFKTLTQKLLNPEE